MSLLHLVASLYLAACLQVVNVNRYCHFISLSQISALKERLSALCCAGGVLASASSSSHKKIVQVELDHFNLQVDFIIRYTLLLYSHIFGNLIPIY